MRRTFILLLGAIWGITRLGGAQQNFEFRIPVSGMGMLAGGVATPDGGFVFAGEQGNQVFILKATGAGDVEWSKVLSKNGVTLGLYGRSLTFAQGVIYLGGYAMGSGTNSRDGIVWGFDLNGQLLFEKLIDVANNSNAIHGLTAFPGGVLATGRRAGAGSYDMLVHMMDNNQNIVVSMGYGSAGWDWGYESIPLSDGNFALVGYGDDVGGAAPSGYLVKFKADGTELWARGIDGNSAEECYALCEDPATGDIFVGGTTLGMGPPGMRGFIAKFSSSGQHLWTLTVDNAFDVIGLARLAPGNFVALLRFQNPNTLDYAPVLLFFNSSGIVTQSYIYLPPDANASLYPYALYVGNSGILITCKISGPTTGLYAIGTDFSGAGTCHSDTFQAVVNTYNASVFNHTSQVQNGATATTLGASVSPVGLTPDWECCIGSVEASFQYAPSGPLQITFSSTSTGAIQNQWFINGQLYTGDVVVVDFPAPGSYAVCLKAFSICGADSVCDSVTVLPTAPLWPHQPQASFSFTPTPEGLYLYHIPCDNTLLSLISLEGKVWKRTLVNPSGNAFIPFTESLPPGLYGLLLQCMGSENRSIHFVKFIHSKK